MNATHYVKRLKLFGILKKAIPEAKWSSQSRHRGNKTKDTKIILSATWVVVMLIYLLGDVLRSTAATWQKIDGRQEFQPVRLAGYRGSDVDANPDGFPDPGIAPVCESLDEYHRGRLLFPVQPA
jgi:hypothetical protein